MLPTDLVLCLLNAMTMRPDHAEPSISAKPTLLNIRQASNLDHRLAQLWLHYNVSESCEQVFSLGSVNI